MKIKDLQYTKIPGGWIGPGGKFEMDTNKMFLLSVNRQNKQTLRLNLKTDQSGTTAYIRAKNLKEELFLNFLEKELSGKFIGKSYDGIINTDFQMWENEKKNKTELTNELKREAELRNEERHETEWKNEEKY